VDYNNQIIAQPKLERLGVKMKENHGYLVVITGNGKGKTTSALGMALRSIGHDQRVIMLQFIKGSMRSGEHIAACKLSPEFEILPLGCGFVNPQNPGTRDVDAVVAAWEISKQKILSGDYSMVILDEINNVIAYGFLPLDSVLETLKYRPPGVTVVLTGRGADPHVIDMADIVTETKEIKHPYQKGCKARKGIEF